MLNGPISAKCDMIERDLGSKSTQGVFFTVIPDHCEPQQIGFGAKRAWNEIVLSSKYVQGKHSQILTCINLHMLYCGEDMEIFP